MANKKRKCKQCKTYQPVANGIVAGLGFFCSSDCRRSFGIEQSSKLAGSAKEKREKEQRKKDKAWLNDNKPLRKLTDEAQSAVNKFIRVRDYGKPCVSCGAPYRTSEGGKFSYFDAGHYRSRGAASHLKFNVFNIAGQCVACNRYKSGNAVDFRINLIERIGIERVERLEHDNEPRKFSIEYLQRVKKIFNKRARFYERRLER